MKSSKTIRRIEADQRTQQFVELFKSYGATIVDHISKNLDQTIDPAFLARVNQTVEPLLRRQIEDLVKDYQRVTYEALTGDAIAPEEVAYRTQFPRRRRYHLRVLTLAISDLVAIDNDDDLAAGAVPRRIARKSSQFPKIIIEGLDLWTRQALQPDDIEAVNMAAFRALDRLDIVTDGASEESDRDMWRLLHDLDDSMSLLCPILVPFLKQFQEDFEAARTVMQRAIGQGSRGAVQLNVKSWDLLFSRIFGRLIRIAATDDRPEQRDHISAADLAIIVGATVKYRHWRLDNQLK